MIDNPTLRDMLAGADDFTAVVEVYPSDAAPPFDPADAELRLAPIGAFSFDGQSYSQRIVRFGKARRTIGKEVNRFSVTLDNTDGVMAAYEFSDGFEGKIMVVRLVSRSESTLSSSLVVFVGRCERPDTADRKQIQMTASQVVGAIDTEIPRRKFQYDDSEGRLPTDPLFEGFRYTPQYGTIEYSQRKRVWWASWLITRDVKKYNQFSSYSDIDANKWVPVVFGRAQLMGMHLAYADVGRFIRMTTAFCEGPIEDITSIRTDDARFQFYNDSGGVTNLNLYSKRYGYPGGTGPTGREQVPYSYAGWQGNGHYSNTALLFSHVTGTDTLQVDPAPGVIAVVLGQLMTIPDGGGYWDATDKWSDNPAAQARHILTSSDYGRLDTAWIDDASFYEAYKYNDEVIYDSSLSDVILSPNSGNYSGGSSSLARYMASTGTVTTS